MGYFNLSTDVDFSHVRPYGTKCMPGVVMVEMAPRDEQAGSLYIPDVLKNKLRTDVGVVVGVGPGVKGWDAREELSIGDVVAVDWKLGSIYQEFGWDGPVARSETRIYGVAGGEPYPYWRAVVMKLMDGRFKALGKQVELKLTPKKGETDSGILLTSRAENREPVATVVSCGPRCEYVKPGDRVVYAESQFRCCNVEEELYVGPEEGILAFQG